MAWFIVIFSTLLYQVVTGTVFARLLDPSLLPRLSLLWVCVLADRTAATPARETDTWLSGFFASCFLGYMLDVSLVAPRGIHASIYGFCFLLVRLMLSRLGQSTRLVQVFLIGAIALGVDVLVWWLKGLTLGFVNFSQFGITSYLVKALTTGATGALVFGFMSRLFADRSDTSQRRL